MADTPQVDSRTTDAATRADAAVLGDFPAVAIATIYQNLAHATGLAMLNAVQQQQQAWTIQSAVTAKLVRGLLEGGPGGGDDDLLEDLLGDFDAAEDEDWIDEDDLP